MECPFCHGEIVEWQDIVTTVRDCEHILFVASDQGFEYTSYRYIDKICKQENELPTSGDMDDFTGDPIYPGAKPGGL